jgi:HTH-type transcriptional regulator / antitoxin HigA
MTSFYLRKNPLFSERDVLAFAKRMGVHPGLVVGQLQWRTDRFELLRRHLAKVREHLCTTMMFDGWGDVMPVGE